MDPAANTQPNQSQKRGTTNQVPPKMFAFDAAFSHDASQVKDLYVFPKYVKRKPLMFKPLIWLKLIFQKQLWLSTFSARLNYIPHSFLHV